MKKTSVERKYYNANLRFRKYHRSNENKLELKPDGTPIIPHRYKKLWEQIEQAKAEALAFGLTEDELKRISDKVFYDELMRSEKPRPSLLARWKQLEAVTRAAIVFVVMTFFIGILGHIFQYRDRDYTFLQRLEQFIIDFYANFSAELLSIAVTVIIIDRLNRKRDEEQHIRRLIRQLKHPNAEDAHIALLELSQEEHLRNGSLEGKSMSYSNLANAHFQAAKLKAVDFSYSKLMKTYWGGADLQRVNFNFANLSGAEMYSANLVGANFLDTDLRGAILVDANLLWAIFRDEFNGLPDPTTGEKRVHVMEAKFDTNTILPNGEKWTPDTDLEYFTNYWYPGGYWKAREMTEN